MLHAVDVRTLIVLDTIVQAKRLGNLNDASEETFWNRFQAVDESSSSISSLIRASVFVWETEQQQKTNTE